MYVIGINHGLSHTGRSYLAAETTEATVIVEDGKEHVVPPHRALGVLELVEATKYESKEEAQFVADNLIPMYEGDEKLTSPENEKFQQFVVVPYEEEVARYNRFVGEGGLHYNRYRQDAVVRQMTAPNQLVVAIDIEDVLFSTKGYYGEAHTALMGRLRERLLWWNNYREAMKTLNHYHDLSVPEAISQTDKQVALLEALAQVRDLLVLCKQYTSLLPFAKEGLVVLTDTEKGTEVEKSPLVGVKLDVLENVARWYVEGDEPLMLDIESIEIMQPVVNYLHFLQTTTERIGIQTFCPVDVQLYSHEPVLLLLADYILSSYVNPAYYRVVTNISGALKTADVHISARGITFMGTMFSPLQISGFSIWNSNVAAPEIAATPNH